MKQGQNIFLKSIVVLFMALLVIPCALKQDVKLNLGIPLTQQINKDKYSCTILTDDITQKHVTSPTDHNTIKQVSLDLLTNITPLHLVPTEQIKIIWNHVSITNVPIFIYLRVLII